ncbi:RagB/SusD family nutrient uptake outer membrane protein [Lacinutrix sp. MedPE-SW]|uniref:RagB/SusD family nutrient uptake outer membrane protein n=1 Tax=Lacinutrix sp. MedPE-SW TaxID=1860087 RepID=UPI0025BFDDCB|nr:RagB/SusD family nutrient uptake outer membrane protein [Lacinutrix sp. MedPE-SW]
MKKIKYIITTFCLFALFACNDATEILPEDNISEENAFATVDDLVVGMNGVFSNYFPEANIRFSSIFTDDTKIGEDSGNQEDNFHNWTLTSSTGNANSIWINSYFLINSANRLIQAASTIAPSADEVDTYNNILGECYALRALAHLDLLSFYSTDFEANTPAVPYIDYVVLLDQPARNTFGEVAEGIKNDLITADGFIDESIVDKTRITKDFLKAVRARLALYEGDYATAETLSGQLIADYPLANQQQYLDMYNADDETEVIFKAARVQGDFITGGIWMFTNNGGSFIEVSNELVSIIPAGDVRDSVIWTNVDATGTVDTQERVNKYPAGSTSGVNYLNDIKVFRSSEMVLINAEAKARKAGPDFAGAAMMVQSIRDARTGSTGTPPNYTSVSVAMEDILFERRLELAFEGHRYVDLRRTRSITNLGIERSSDLGDCESNVTPECTLSPIDPRFTLPIPNTELDGNANISQTQGYN